MTAPLVTKAEVLLTRRCNIMCSTCAVIHPAMEDGKPNSTAHGELTVEEWKRAFDVVYGKLGATFIAIYGGEPLVYSDEFLCELFRHLSTWRTNTRDFTVISNGIGLSRRRAAKFVESGLESWTSSVDTAELTAVGIGDKYMNAKTSAGLRALKMMREEFGLRDTCGIITVTDQNLDQVIPTVEFLCGHGHWVGIDFLHWQRGDGEYTFSTTLDEMRKEGVWPVRAQQMGRVREVAKYLLDHHSDLLVFPTKRVLEMWSDVRMVRGLGWKCQPGHSITIDSNGQIGLCDDRMPNGYGSERTELLPSGQPWSIFHFERDGEALTDCWRQFIDWYGKDLEKCEGCFWSTHVMAVDALHDEKLRGHYVHKVTPGEL